MRLCRQVGGVHAAVLRVTGWVPRCGMSSAQGWAPGCGMSSGSSSSRPACRRSRSKPPHPTASTAQLRTPAGSPASSSSGTPCSLSGGSTRAVSSPPYKHPVSSPVAARCSCRRLHSKAGGQVMPRLGQEAGGSCCRRVSIASSTEAEHRHKAEPDMAPFPPMLLPPGCGRACKEHGRSLTHRLAS